VITLVRLLRRRRVATVLHESRAFNKLGGERRREKGDLKRGERGVLARIEFYNLINTKL
jgi:hypothetical protein